MGEPIAAPRGRVRLARRNPALKKGESSKMKRNLLAPLLTLALLLFPALAQGEDCALVRLNDGAPIQIGRAHV